MPIFACATAPLSFKDSPRSSLVAPPSQGFRKNFGRSPLLTPSQTFSQPQAFSFWMPCCATGTNSRQRHFTPHVTFWALLAQTLAPETSCRDIVRKVQAWWLLRAPKSSAGSSSTAAYTKARQRLDPTTIHHVGEHLTERLEGRVQSSQLWLGRRVRVVDGTTVSMPDTAEN